MRLVIKYDVHPVRDNAYCSACHRKTGMGVLIHQRTKTPVRDLPFLFLCRVCVRRVAKA